MSDQPDCKRCPRMAVLEAENAKIRARLDRVESAFWSVHHGWRFAGKILLEQWPVEVRATEAIEAARRVVT